MTPLKAVWPASMRWILIIVPLVEGYVPGSFESVRDEHGNRGIYTSTVRGALENGEPFLPEESA